MPQPLKKVQRTEAFCLLTAVAEASIVSVEGNPRSCVGRAGDTVQDISFTSV